MAKVYKVRRTPAQLKQFIFILCALSILLQPSEANAAIRNIDGNQLYNYCSVNANQTPPNDVAMQAWACLGYVSAIVDALSGDNSISGKRACIPANSDTNQIVNVFRNYIREHPGAGHLLAAGLLADALTRAFPCRPAP